MTALTRAPDNRNPLQPSKYLITFPKLPGTTFFCQSVNIPGVYIDVIEQPTRFINLPVPGKGFNFEELQMTFIVDQELVGWRQIYDWIRAMGFPESHEEYRQLPKQMPYLQQSPLPQYSDATLTILSGLNNPKFRIKFRDIFPYSLSGIDFTSTSTDEDVITARATFRYAYYDIEKV